MLNIRSLGPKEFILKKKSFSRFASPCFYCSADSLELKSFLILTIGGLALCSLFVFVGLWLKGAFRATEELCDQPLKAESKGSKNE
jgi:hypothetical protein